jgi:hypothetical protein
MTGKAEIARGPGGEVQTPITLCVPPRAGELCAPIRFLLRHDSVVMELTARHMITAVEWDSNEQAVAVSVEITDPETARPVDVRFDVVPPGGGHPSGHARRLGRVLRNGQAFDVLGTYLGVVADEN